MTQLEALMNLGMSEAEARQVLEDDKRIDKGENLFELSPEGKAVEKKMRQADRKKPFVPDLKPRERKPNEAKRELIQLLYDSLRESLKESEDNYQDPIITNQERQIDFVYQGVNYRIVLSAPRK